MEMMWKFHKQDELNCNQRITSDAMLPKLWKDLTVTVSMEGMRLFFTISSYFTASDHNKL